MSIQPINNNATPSMPTRIIVSGLGGVGGYYGGLLAHYAQTHPEANVEVDFLMRSGTHFQKVQERGLLVKWPEGKIIAHPHRISLFASELAPANYLILATKSYNLRENIEQIKPFLTANTVVLPLLNGLDVHDFLEELLPPEVIRWVGCVFITSRRTEPGCIQSNSTYERLFMGLPNRNSPTERTPQEEYLEALMKASGIGVVVPDDPMDEVRKKYLMLSNSAAATAYLNTNVDGLVGQYRSFTEGLTQELINLYQAKGWKVEDDAVEAALRRIGRMPSGTTTSMHSDLQKGHTSEVESLVGYVVRESQKLGLLTPFFSEAYQGICANLSSQKSL